ncbi:MAG: hypothetical protein LBR86_00330 [Tannerella sp.]|nr:hypothetical protein [Tannerella sp.]
MILSIAITAMATLNSTTVYSQKGKQPAQNITVMQLGQETIYAICTAFPKDKLEIYSLYLNSGKSTVTLIGAEETQLKWAQHPTWNDSRYTQLVIDIPDSLYDKRKNEYAWVFKITF